MARPYGLPGKAKMARTRIHRRCCHNPLALGKIELRTATADEETTRWRELFRYPRSMAAGCLIALSQTGGAGILMWITALFVMVLKVTPNEAAYLMIWVGVLGIIGRLVASWMSDTVGRRYSGFLIGMGGAVAMALAGHIHPISRRKARLPTCSMLRWPGMARKT